MFELSPETKLDWARKQRRIFTTPTKDALGGLVLGVAYGITAFLASVATWKRDAVIAVIAGIGGGFLCPWLETVFWRFRFASVKLEEKEEEVRRLRAYLSEREAEYDAQRAAANQANVRVAAPIAVPEHGAVDELQRLLTERIAAAHYEYRPEYANTRSFTPRTVRELFAIVRENTAVKAEAAIEQQVGLWLRVEGPIENVLEHEIAVTVMIDAAHYGVVTSSIALGCGGSLRKLITSLDVNDRVEANGEIWKIDRLTITLRRCELLSINGKPVR